MGRRLAEATKARRTRRTRGETLLCFLLAAAEAVPFFPVGGVVFPPADFGVEPFDPVLFDTVFLAGALSAEGNAWGSASAGGKKPSEGRNKIPA